jgi:hypothetical protein
VYGWLRGGHGGFSLFILSSADVAAYFSFMLFLFLSSLKLYIASFYMHLRFATRGSKKTGAGKDEGGRGYTYGLDLGSLRASSAAIFVSARCGAVSRDTAGDLREVTRRPRSATAGLMAEVTL